MNFFAQTPDTQPNVHGITAQPDTAKPLPVDAADDGYRISCPPHLRPRFHGLDQQGRYSADGDDSRRIGWGAFLPAVIAMCLVGACAALVLLLKDFSQ